MKWLTLLLTLCLSNVYAQFNSQYLHHVNEILPAIGKNDANGNFSTKRSLSSRNFNVNYYRCIWETDPEIRFIRGVVTLYFNISSDADNIILDLNKSMIVDSVFSSSMKRSFEHADNSLKILFNATTLKGTSDSATIYYHGVPENNGFGSFTNSIHNGVPVMWTLSEPYGSSDWWPCRNGLDDKTDSIDVYIKAPATYTAVSNGIRQSEVIEGSMKTTHWRHRYPIAAYLVAMAVTNYTGFNNYVNVSGKDLLMQTFCYPESLAEFQANTYKVLEAMQYFSGLVGEYPFIKEKYGHTQFGFGGGEEHQTNTFLSYPDESLMAHELAHQWFGDKVTCASWRHIWLNEGFASHLASMFMEQKYPQTAINIRKIETDQITALPNGSVYVDDTTSVNRIFNNRLTYKKGSHLIYMLRWILGDDVFFKAIKDYLNDPKLIYGFALTKDLQYHLEKVSGKKLDYFFDEWFYGQGYPSYHIDWWQQDPSTVGMRVSQTTSDPSVNYFNLPVEVKIKNGSQEKSVIIDPQFNGQIFFIDNAFVSDTIEIDPEYWLITKNNTASKIGIPETLKEVRIYPNPTQQNLTVFLNGFSETVMTFRLYSMDGKLLKSETNPLNGSLKKEIDMNLFPSGMYLLKITSPKGYSSIHKIQKR